MDRIKESEGYTHFEVVLVFVLTVVRSSIKGRYRSREGFNI